MKKAFVLLLIILLAIVVESRIQNLKRGNGRKGDKNSKKGGQNNSNDDSQSQKSVGSQSSGASSKSDETSQSSQSDKDDQNPVCGDGVIEGSQLCEDGISVPDGFHCENCQLVDNPEPVCGDGIAEGDQTCDEGTPVPDGYLCQNCQLVEIPEPVCGDGVVEGTEQCQEGTPIPEGHDCQNCQIVCNCPQNFNYYPCQDICSTTYMDSFSCEGTQCTITSCPLPEGFENIQFLPEITDQLAALVDTELSKVKTHQDLVFYVDKAPLSPNIKVGSAQLASDLGTLVYANNPFIQALQDCTGVFPIFSGETPSV